MTISNQDLVLFNNIIKSSSSYDFSEYSDKSLKRRLAKILLDQKLEFSTFLVLLKSDPTFLEKVVKDITVNTTELFRDPNIWQVLRYNILPKFKNQQSINIWHAGCSTGQEVYSMLILLNEANLFDKAKVYGTDINSDVLQVAKKGAYKFRFNINYLDNFDKAIKENPYNYEAFEDIPYEKYFTIDKSRDLIRMNPFLLEKPVFKKQDLVKDSNLFYVKFDLILCRNVIIYFNYELQNKVFELFHNNLYPNGFLLLGMHESILGPFSSRFEKQGHFYQKKDSFNYIPL